MFGINAVLECPREKLGWMCFCTDPVLRMVSSSLPASSGLTMAWEHEHVRARLPHFLEVPHPSELGSFAFYTNSCAAGGKRECIHRIKVKQPCSPAAFCWSCSPYGQKLATIFIWWWPYWMDGGGECMPLRRGHLISRSSHHGLQDHSQFLMPSWVGKSLVREKWTENNFVFLPTLWLVASLSRDPMKTKRKWYICADMEMSHTSHWNNKCVLRQSLYLIYYSLPHL